MAWGGNVLLASILAQEFDLNQLDGFSTVKNKTIWFCQSPPLPFNQVKEQKGLELSSLSKVIEFGLYEINLQIVLFSICNVNRM